MPEVLPHTPYHIAEQNADALLPPIGAALDELVTRLGQYHDRLRMSDADRTRVGRARDAVRLARAAFPARLANR